MALKQDYKGLAWRPELPLKQVADGSRAGRLGFFCDLIDCEKQVVR